MQVKLSMNEEEIRQAIAEYILAHFHVSVDSSQLYIQVKSKQNYKSEWEQAAIRVDCEAGAKE